MWSHSTAINPRSSAVKTTFGQAATSFAGDAAPPSIAAKASKIRVGLPAVGM